MLTDLWHSETEPVADARRILLAAVEEFRPSHVFGLLSGGNDSACTCHVAAGVLGDRLSGVVHIDTQTGIPETRAHVDRLCGHFGWRLLTYSPPLPEWAGSESRTAYEAIVRRAGFPGPWMHPLVYRLLKERCLRRLIREHKAGRNGRVMLVAGARMAESRRRMGTAQEARRDGATVWVNPIIRWEAWDKDEYQRQNEIPPNPVTEHLGISGECCCGCFACPGEFARIERHYPDHATYLRRLEEMAESHGVPAVWGEPPPKPVVPDPPLEDDGGWLTGLCWSCNARRQPIATNAGSPAAERRRGEVVRI